jgi:hypothetical protein
MRRLRELVLGHLEVEVSRGFNKSAIGTPKEGCEMCCHTHQLLQIKIWCPRLLGTTEQDLTIPHFVLLAGKAQTLREVPVTPSATHLLNIIFERERGAIMNYSAYVWLGNTHAVGNRATKDLQFSIEKPMMGRHAVFQ